MGQQPRFTDVVVEQIGSTAKKRDQYYGKPLATCIQDIITKQDEACTGDEILTALIQGAFDFKPTGWKEEDRLRSLSIAMSKNPVFHRLPNGTWGLLSRYPEVAARKAKEKKQAANGGSKDDANEGGGEQES